MARKPYRVEANYPQGGQPQFYLVKDVKVGQKKSKVKKYLGSGSPPTSRELAAFRRDYAFDLEMKAAKKKAQLNADHFRSSYLSNEEVINLEELRFIYRSFTDLLTVNEAESYEKNFEVSYVHGTTSIEGNTLSLAETHSLLEQGVAPNAKTLREINEVQNFKNVLLYRNRYKGKVTLDFIKTMHSMIMNNIDTESAGTFRRIDGIGIGGCDLSVTPADMIEMELKELIDEYYGSVMDSKHPFEAAVIFHYKFEMIHPFTDGNGRVGREVFNYLLLREKFPKLLFLGRDRDRYINALRLGNEDKFEEMIHLFYDLIMNQRMDILIENLQKVVTPIKKSGQMMLDDFPVVRND